MNETTYYEPKEMVSRFDVSQFGQEKAAATKTGDSEELPTIGEAGWCRPDNMGVTSMIMGRRTTTGGYFTRFGESC